MIRHLAGRGGLGPPARTHTLRLPGCRKRAVSILGVACLTLFSLACGVQGLPRPPRIEQPATVTDLAVAQKGRTLRLSFTLPLRATDGERLTKPVEVQIFRTATSSDEKASGAPAPSNPWLTLPAKDLERYTQGEKTVFPLTLSEEEMRGKKGATFVFALRTLTLGFRHRPVESELSNTVYVTFLDVSEPVKDLQVQATEQAVALSWSPPAQSASGQPVSNLSGYRVYRSRTGKPGSFQLLGETRSSTYGDPNFRFDQTYFYRVAAVSREASQVAESEDSPVVEITPHDTFPPAAPTGLSAIYAAEAVELVWTANAEPDLAGYHVYRHEQDGPSQKLNPELVRTPIFRDTAVEAGHKYIYQVTALDLSNNESVPSEEVTVETR